ncbi:MAG: hypothetical protein JXR42_04035 [Gammaproteobacteria bacterium]|nr:hypothetical protein [Gammaproteobacteria bacterium]
MFKNRLRHWINSKVIFSVATLALPLVLFEGLLHSRELIITRFTSVLGTADIAAYSIGYTLFNLILSFNMGFTMGLGVVATREMGRKNYSEVTKIMVNGYFIGILLAVILGIAIFNMGLLLHSIKEPPKLILLASQFTYMLSFAALPATIAIVSEQLALLVDKPKFILMFGLITVIGIVFFTYIFGMGHLGSPMMGLKGFGLAILLAGSMECFCWVLFITFHSELKNFYFRKKLLSIKPAIIIEIFRVGLPLGIKQIIAVNGVLWVFTLIIGKIGTVDLAVFQLLLAFITITSAIPNGVSRVVAIKVGKQLGALRLSIARQYSDAGLLIVCSIIILVGLFMLFEPNQLIGLLLTPHNAQERQVFQIAVNLLRLSGPLALVAALMIIGYSILAGFKDTFFTLIAESGSVWLVSLPVGYSLYRIFHGGVRDYWFGLFVGICLCVVIYAFRIRYKFKKREYL